MKVRVLILLFVVTMASSIKIGWKVIQLPKFVIETTTTPKPKPPPLLEMIMDQKLRCLGLKSKRDTESTESKSLLPVAPEMEWCRADNISAQAGNHSAWDNCCRTHGGCDKFIKPGETKYNLTNTGNTTRVDCHCYNKFLNCIRKSGNNVTEVDLAPAHGEICFGNRNPNASCRRYSESTGRCVKYALVGEQPNSYRWHIISVSTP